jgi:hypothetical protein
VDGQKATANSHCVFTVATMTMAAEENGSNGAGISEAWGRDRLLGKTVSFKGVADGDVSGEIVTNGSSKAPESPKKKNKSKKGGAAAAKLDPMLWGQPGHLTEDEADVYVSESTLLSSLVWG